MSWLDDVVQRLADQPVCGYVAGAAPATEPTALAALALLAHGQSDKAQPAIDHLSRSQAEDGSVGVRPGEPPGWPTSLAVLAWRAANRSGANDPQIELGVAWILEARGEAIEDADIFGHDASLIGWSYAEQTHSWIEPTALHIAALKATGHGEHPRTREGVRLLLDRQLPAGGCNYGNTVVLGQTLRPHVQPTGIALLALAGETDNSRLAKSVAWLRRSIAGDTPTASLCWAVLGLQAHRVALPEVGAWLAAAHQRTANQGNAPHKLALLALAEKGWPQ